jgi:hypothetical protein
MCYLLVRQQVFLTQKATLLPPSSLPTPHPTFRFIFPVCLLTSSLQVDGQDRAGMAPAAQAAALRRKEKQRERAAAAAAATAAKDERRAAKRAGAVERVVLHPTALRDTCHCACPAAQLVQLCAGTSPVPQPPTQCAHMPHHVCS